MGQAQATSSSEKHYAETLQLRRGHLPKSTKIDGRFVIDKNLFPEWVDHISGGKKE